MIREENETTKKEIKAQEVTQNKKFDKLKSKLKQTVNIVKQQNERIRTLQEKIQLQENEALFIKAQQEKDKVEHESCREMLKQLKEKITQQENKPATKSSHFDLERIVQELESFRNDFNSELAKFRRKITKMEDDVARLQTEKSENELHNEKLGFYSKKLQVYCEGLKERYDLMLKEIRTENSNFQASINDQSSKYNAMRQHIEKLASNLAELEKGVQKKTTALSNAINVLVEMVNNSKQNEFENFHSVDQSTATTHIYQ
jgi:chromosome segregation ATPase